MVNTKLLLCFVLAVSVVKIIECRGRGGGHGSHGSHGHGSHGSHGGGWFSGWGKSRSSSHSYPASNGYSGHGSGGSHSYPPSNGYSGSGGSHSYPPSHGYSGHGSGGSRTSSGYWGATRHVPSVPTYYTSPQHVYVTQYRNSDSQYSDLLTGLTMYNLGRSHGHYHHHYYRDDYYRSSTNHRDTNTAELSPNEEATCFLRIKRNNQEDVLKIPCAIVSTFDSGATEIEDLVSNKPSNNCSSVLNETLDNKLQNATLDSQLTNANLDNKLANETLDSKLTNATFNDQLTNVTLDAKLTVNETNLNATTKNETSSHMTEACKGTVAVEDPLAVKGAPVDVKDMECSVEIRARIAGQEKIQVTRNNVDCKALLLQAKMPVPENKDSDILPSRQTLKAMLDKPPWWFSLFFAV